MKPLFYLLILFILVAAAIWLPLKLLGFGPEFSIGHNFGVGWIASIIGGGVLTFAPYMIESLFGEIHNN